VDTRTFIVELVRALAWPVVVLIGFAIIRKPLFTLLGSMRRLKYGDAEAEFADGLKEVAPQVPPSSAPPRVPSDIESPELAVLDAWRSVETAVLDLGRRSGALGRSVQEVIRQLREKGIVTDKELDSMNGLRALRNLVAHREEPSVSKQKAAEYVAMADAVKMLVEQKARKAAG
jgi:Domain of unknown function (DUF4145)